MKKFHIRDEGMLRGTTRIFTPNRGKLSFSAFYVCQPAAATHITLHRSGSKVKFRALPRARELAADDPRSLSAESNPTLPFHCL